MTDMSEKSAALFGIPAPEQGVRAGSAGERPSEKAAARFYEGRGTLLLELGGRERLDPEFITDAESQGFMPKDELHMTIIGFRQGKQVKKLLKADVGLAAEISALAESIEWDVQPTGERYLLTKQYEGEAVPRQSIIEMVDCQAASGFIEQLNDLTGLQLEEQPPHLTLATRGDASGVGVNSGQDILDYGQRLA